MGRFGISTRRAIFESCEQRIVLSGMPVADFYLDGFEAPPLQHFAGPVAEWVSGWAADSVNYVRSTYGLRGTGQTVAVIDSGIAWDHYALGRGFGEGYRVVGGWDFTEENDANPYDDGPAGFHGTHVAGIIASDDARHPGVAPDVDLVALRVFNDQGAGYFEWVEKALQWVHHHRNAFENPITVVNLSLGTDWNANRVPGWSMIEDELAQLEADGIFIAVAAGNSFQQYRTPGLSYPAASSYVVPVASVSRTGQLSSFSQRNSRVLAAPGESITSTVPDHIYGVDGVPNDFGSASGTSMATPYVAGAAVLVREAMQFVGLQNITQDAIYDHLRSTADVIYDALTSSHYHRVNLQRAIDVLLGVDDYGSTLDTAYHFTNLAGGSLSGSISSLHDVDFFTFRADVSGTVTLQLETSGALNPRFTLYGATASMTDGTVTFAVQAGQTYSFSIATTDGIGHYSIASQFETAIQTIDWGTVEHKWMSGQDASVLSHQYQITASRDGLLTVTAQYAASRGNVQLEIYNVEGRLLSRSAPGAGTRVDVRAQAGEQFLLRLSGSNRDVELYLSNLVAIDGTSVTVYGTEGDDVFEYTTSSGALRVNGIQYQLDTTEAIRVRVEAGGGHDQVRIVHDAGGASTAEMHVGHSLLKFGRREVAVAGAEDVQFQLVRGAGTATLYDSAGNDVFSFTPGSVALRGDGYQHHLQGFQSVVAVASRGFDTAHFAGSAGNDQFTGEAARSILQAAGFRAETRGFDSIHVSAQGGHDVARLYGSAGTDRLTIRPQSATFDTAEVAFRVTGFTEVHATAGTGGDDRAALYDSAGDDVVTTSATTTLVQGDHYIAEAVGFHRVDSFATAGGIDVVHFADTAGDDRFTASPDTATLEGSSYHVSARGFERVVARSTAGGRDLALVYDSPGDDLLQSYSTHSVLTGSRYTIEAHGFSRVNVYASTGHDHAELFDSAGADRFYARPQYAYLHGAGFYNFARGFDVVVGSSSGGDDVAYLYDAATDDRLTVRPDGVSIATPDSLSTAHGFSRTYSYATTGRDTAEFWDSASDDRFVAVPGTSTLSGPGFVHVAQGFHTVVAHATAGGRDEAVLYDSPGDDQLLSHLAYTELIGASFQHRITGFEQVATYSRSGRDRATFFNLVGSGQLARLGDSMLVNRGFRLERVYEFAEYLSTLAATNEAQRDAVDELFRQLGPEPASPA